jgi:hypothetical protein
MAVTMKNAVFWDIKPSSYFTGDILRLRYRAQPVRLLTYEVFTAGTMKNAVFWDIKTQFVPHRRHITSLLQSPAG